MSCWSDSGPSCPASRCIYTLKPITEVKQRWVWLVLGWVTHKTQVDFDPLRVKTSDIFSEIVFGGSKSWENGKKNFGFFSDPSLPPILLNCGRTVGRIKNLRPPRERKFYVEYLVFYDFLSSDALFGRHVGLCVVLGLFFHFWTANMGCSFHFGETFA